MLFVQSPTFFALYAQSPKVPTIAFLAMVSMSSWGNWSSSIARRPRAGQPFHAGDKWAALPRKTKGSLDVLRIRYRAARRTSAVATMYRYGRGRRVFRRRAAAVVSSMLARKIRGLRRAPRVPRELLLGRIQKAHRPAARQQRGRARACGANRGSAARPRHKPTRRALASEGSPTRRHVGPQQQEPIDGHVHPIQ
jgi:hypothetical protein